MRRRTRARETAIQFLYQLDLRGEVAFSELDTFLDESLGRDGSVPDPDLRAFAKRLVIGTRDSQAELDRMLREVARNWDLKRMATIDRNILRMAMYELLHCGDIPPKVSINEAIELAKKFSTANSGAFVNGILDRVRLDHTADQPGSTTSPESAGEAGA